METSNFTKLPTTIRPLFTPPVFVLGFLATGTILTAIILEASSFPITGLSLGESHSFESASLVLFNTLSIVSIIAACFLYLVRANPEYDVFSSLSSLGVGLLLGFVIIIASGDNPLAIIDTFTIAPLFTIAALSIGLIYYLALHTQLDWIAMNFAGVLLIAPVIAMYAIGSPLWVIGGVLIGSALVDFIGVHKTSVIQTIASKMLPLRLPVAFVYLTEAESLSTAVNGDEFNGLNMLGLGDVAIPGVFIASIAIHSSAFLPVTALFALSGYCLAFLFLNIDPFDIQIYAALPFLNTGTLLGYLAALPFM